MSVPVHIDPGEMRSKILAEIVRYEDAIEEAGRHRPQVSPSDFGEGFVSHGERLAAAVDGVHEQSVRRLQQRIDQLHQVLALIDDVAAADRDTAEGFAAYE